MNPQERLAHALRQPYNAYNRRDRIYAALDDMTADQVKCGARLVTELEKPYPFSHDDAPLEPEPMRVDFSATIENAESADINIKVTR